ncbi:hypothetical protein Tco_0955724 [Tanacetum coccineum]|uniref:Uncharacterized protein n=1 Tax=Tanacetum coccineum TaxID=301880 RepID=A0ABQ5E802_9ASTR
MIFSGATTIITNAIEQSKEFWKGVHRSSGTTFVISIAESMKETTFDNLSTTNNSTSIDAIDADDDITLVSVHDVNVIAGEEEVIEVINTAKLIINATQVSAAGDKVSTAGAATTVSIATTTTATTVEEITLAQVLADLKNTKPIVKGIAFKESGESITTTTPIPSKI